MFCKILESPKSEMRNQESLKVTEEIDNINKKLEIYSSVYTQSKLSRSLIDFFIAAFGI